MQIQRWDPFHELRQLTGSPESFVRGFGVKPVGRASGRWTLPLDVAGNDDSLVVSASIPGVAPEDIKVTVEDGILSIAASANEENESAKSGYLLRERRSGSFFRAVRLPEGVSADGAESEYRNGVLTITLPKEESSKSQVIDVKVRN